MTTVCVSLALSLEKPGVSVSMLLERREEDVLFRHYERRLMDFCNAFKPAMPKSVVVCARSPPPQCSSQNVLRDDVSLDRV